MSSGFQDPALPAPEAALPFDLRGRRAFVPGGTGWLGEAIARGLALAGARVVLAGRDEERAGATATKIAGETGGEVSGLACNVADLASIEAATDGAAERLGGIDILVNCVGMQIEQPLLDVTAAAFDQLYEVNLKSAMFLAQSVARKQVAVGAGGRQIHLLSVRSQLALRGKGYSAYCATKGALVLLVRQHAMELAPHGITVNGVAPTFVDSPMIAHVHARPEFKAEILARIPLGRLALPGDVVGPVLFLASPAAGFMTGQVLYVDGGITASQ